MLFLILLLVWQAPLRVRNANQTRHQLVLNLLWLKSDQTRQQPVLNLWTDLNCYQPDLITRSVELRVDWDDRL